MIKCCKVDEEWNPHAHDMAYCHVIATQSSSTQPLTGEQIKKFATAMQLLRLQPVELPPVPRFRPGSSENIASSLLARLYPWGFWSLEHENTIGKWKEALQSHNSEFSGRVAFLAVLTIL